MTWRIVKADGHSVESHNSVMGVSRALMILSAHEIKNGRVADYRIEPVIINGPTIDEMDLPRWALEALEVEGHNPNG